MKKTEIIATGIILVVITFTIGIITINFNGLRFGLYNVTEFWENILVEAHGIIMDLFIVGFVLLTLTFRMEKKRSIKVLHNKIEFNRNIKTEEAKYNIFSSIGLLNEVKQTKIDLDQCELSDLIMTKINLTGSSINAVNFTSTNLRNSYFLKVKGGRAIFNNTNLINVKFIGSKLTRGEFNKVEARSSSFKDSEIVRTKFCDSDLNNIDFRDCVIDRVDFNRANLKNADFRNCKFGNEITFSDCDLQSSDFRTTVNLPILEIAKAKNLRKAKFDDDIVGKLKKLNVNIEK